MLLIMKEEIINGIRYRLNGGTLTAEVIKKNEGCEGEIIIPKTVVFNELTYRVTSIGEEAFEDCDGLTSIVIPEGLKSIGANAFSGTSLASVVIPNSVTSIGERAFAGSSIRSVVIPDSVMSIGERAFEECLDLASVVIPDSVQSIGKYAFHRCTSLKAISIPNSVMIVEEGAFFRCTSLKIIAIPSNAIIVERGAFLNCDSLQAIRYGGTVEQCKRRYRYWDDISFHNKTVYCIDDDVTIRF